ncbi:Protein Fem-1 A [Manis pentadactyla]|nr:Protein Fem-1 A [Manis pentadactyla]
MPPASGHVNVRRAHQLTLTTRSNSDPLRAQADEGAPSYHSAETRTQAGRPSPPTNLHLTTLSASLMKLTVKLEKI